MPVLNPASAEPATPGLRELIDSSPIWPAASRQALTDTGVPSYCIPERFGLQPHLQ